MLTLLPVTTDTSRRPNRPESKGLRASAPQRKPPALTLAEPPSSPPAFNPPLSPLRAAKLQAREAEDTFRRLQMTEPLGSAVLADASRRLVESQRRLDALVRGT
jgi:hypothetical protein